MAEDGCKIKSTTNAALGVLKLAVRGLGWRYLAFCILTIVCALAFTLPPRLYVYYSENISSLAISQITVEKFLPQFAMFAFIAAAIVSVSTFLVTIAEEWIFLRVEALMRRKVLNTLHTRSLQVIGDTQRGDWLSRLAGDLRGVESFITTSIPEQLRQLVILIVVGSIFASQNWRLAGTLAAAVLLLGVLNAWAQSKLNPLFLELRRMHSDIYQALLESYEGARTIRSMSAEATVARVFDRKVSRIIARGLQVILRVAALVSSNSLFNSVLITGALLAVAWRLTPGAFRVGDILEYPFYLTIFCNAAMSLVRSMLDWGHFFVEGSRVAEMIDETASMDSAPVTSIPASFAANDSKEDGVAKIRISDITVGFLGRSSLTKPFTIQINKGSTLLIKGPSGCGKSTLLDMLAGLRPFECRRLAFQNAKGEEMFSQIGGSSGESAMLLPTSLFAYVDQVPYLFEGSLAENLRLNDSKICSDDELWEALSAVNLEAHVRRSGGLDSVISDMGHNLSYGQRYRLGLARALLLKRPFLLLDEPFASLDDFSANAVCLAINECKSSQGVVVASHNEPSALMVEDTLDMSRFSDVSGPAGNSSQSKAPNAMGSLLDISNGLLTTTLEN